MIELRHIFHLEQAKNRRVRVEKTVAERRKRRRMIEDETDIAHIVVYAKKDREIIESKKFDYSDTSGFGTTKFRAKMAAEIYALHSLAKAWKAPRSSSTISHGAVGGCTVSRGVQAGEPAVQG